MSGAGRTFHQQAELKSDLFGAMERGVLEHADGSSAACVRRNIARAPWWTRPLASYLARRERIVLTRLAGSDPVRCGRAPALLEVSRGGLIRGWIDGSPMHVAKPRDPEYYSEARRLLQALRREGVLHIDTAKEPNWLVTPGGEPALVDFQVSVLFRASPRRRRGVRARLVRMMAREDIRHLLKHKRTYCADALTDRERRILARPSGVSRVWRRSGKRVYNWITRRVFDWSDGEGTGRRQRRNQGLE